MKLTVEWLTVPWNIALIINDEPSWNHRQIRKLSRSSLGWNAWLDKNKFTYVNDWGITIQFIAVKPLEVRILNPVTPLVADRRYEVNCESIGSRPNAIITWYKGKRQLRRAKVSNERSYVVVESLIASLS